MKVNSYQTLEEKVNDIYCLFQGGICDSKLFLKYIRIPLTEQKSLRGLSENQLRKVYHYLSSEKRIANRDLRTIEEHAVPINVIADILLSRYKSSPKSFTKPFIRDVLEKCLWIVFITPDENKALNDLGLKQSMPNGWKWNEDSPFLRYQKAGIEITL